MSIQRALHRPPVAAAAIWLTATWLTVAAATPTHARAADVAPDPARDTVVETQLLSRGAKEHVARRQAMLASSAPDSSRAAGGSGAAITSSLSPAARVNAARELIQASRRSGDPRLLGYAEAELAALPADAGVAAATESLVLRATVQQAQHRFDAARELLDAALARQPDHAQALITRATVLLVQGRIAAARADCERLARTAADAAAICGASVDAASGHNARARAAAESVARSGDASLRGWALAVAAEVVAMDGDAPGALRLYSRALAADDDLHTRVALANALVDASQPQAAQSVLAAAPSTDGVLLARWRAARELGATAQAGALETQLLARFGVDAARGAPLHLREAGAFALERGETRTALQMATGNFASQRTADDVLLLARAARVAGDAEQLRSVRDWVRQTGLKDARIAAVAGGADR